MIIRPETLNDLPAISQLHARAFEHRAAEAAIVLLHHQYRAFDPELSLVAEVDGQIIGHALFNPQIIRLLGQDVRAVNLAPIAIDPHYQGKRIGSTLMHEGHRLAKYKGYALSFLLGHPTYYTRFGYQTHAFGSSTLTYLPQPASLPLKMRAPVEADIPALFKLWRQEEGEIDFAIQPGPSMLDWVSLTAPAQVYLLEDEIIGYTRGTPDNLRVFLAHDTRSAQAVASAFSSKPLTLPLHPYSGSSLGTPQVTPWEAGMALSLTDNPFDDYMAQVKRGQRVVGRPLWPVAFEVE
ncbi:MAG: hypothetical protein OHK0046_09310 [Anaerolineae bacterium]